MTGRESMKIVPPGKKKCVWMEAGVVSYKLCDNNYDCSTCQYDHAMQVKVSQQKEAAAAQISSEAPAEKLKFSETWVDKMMKLPASQRKCRYMITGEIARKICPNAYECGNCSFDQMMQERLQAEVLPLRAQHETGGFRLADDFYYHEGHAWAKPEYGGRVRVGLDDFAQRLVGRLSKLDVPNVGHHIHQGEVVFQVLRNGDVAHVLSPVDGTVEHVNNKLLEHPELINESPYEKGWILIIEPTKLRQNLKELFYGEEADQYFIEEKERLIATANEDLKLAADGGSLEDEVFRKLKGTKWSKLVRRFLRT